MTALVRARDASVGYAGRPLLEKVDLEVSPGDEISLSGRSGSGKSTLILALAGLLPVPGISWPMLSDDAIVRAGQIGVIFQAPSLLPELTALENVALPLRLRGTGRDLAYETARSALIDLGLAGAEEAMPAELSGGQQQRAAIARVLAGRPQLVLADEPTGSLDSATADQVVGLLRRQVQSNGGALLLATHDTKLAARLPTRLAVSERRLTSLVGAV